LGAVELNEILIGGDQPAEVHRGVKGQEQLGAADAHRVDLDPIGNPARAGVEQQRMRRTVEAHHVGRVDRQPPRKLYRGVQREQEVAVGCYVVGVHIGRIGQRAKEHRRRGTHQVVGDHVVIVECDAADLDGYVRRELDDLGNALACANKQRSNQNG
jgi:hypothetical protein